MSKFGKFQVLMNTITDFPLTITVYDDKDNIVQEEVIQYSNYEHRKFLGRLTFQACSQGYTVETRASTDEEKKRMK